MTRGTLILAAAAALVAAGVACRPAALLTRDELKMTVTEHEQAAAAEDAHTSSELAGVPGVDHRKLAEAHRAAAEVLRERESQACAGTPETAVRYPLASATVVAAEPIRESWSRNAAPFGRGFTPARLVGVRLTVHTSLSPDVFGGHLSCRAAHLRASGDDGTDPTSVHGAIVNVTRKEQTLLVVDIRTDEETCAEDALRRGQRLVTR